MKKSSGRTRVIFDAKGNGRREIEVAPGRWKADLGMDTATLRILDPSARPSVSNHATRRPGLMPYGQRPVEDKSLKQRNRLDYLRALSDEIKRQREANRDEAVDD